VGEQDRINTIGLNALLPKRHQRGGAKIDGKPDAGSVNQNTRLKPASTAKGIAGTHKADGDRHTQLLSFGDL
jgi:hypothetical protein